MRRVLLIAACLFLLLAVVPLASAQQGQTIHVVQPGENLFRISLRYGVSMGAIAQANGIANINLIFVGQRLVIPGVGAPVPTPVPATPVPGAPTPVPPTTGTYVVQRGDTLSAIARRFNTTVQALAAANGIANPNLIYPGQVLQVGGGGTGTTPPPVVTPPPGPPVTTGFSLGGHVFGFSYPDQMRGAGMTWAKTQIIWNQGDPPSIVQGAIDAARSRNFKILLGIVGNPAQLAANPTQYYQDFANFLGGVASLNPDGIEVWNEPNIDRQWPAGQISGQNYTQMLSAAFQAIKRANPNVLVASGAPAPTGFFGNRCTGQGCDDNVFIQQMAAAGASQFMDCVGIHYNEGILPPSATSGDPRGNSGHYSRYYTSMVNLYASVFPNKPLCFTELGYITPEGYPGGQLPSGFDWGQGNTLQEQAEWLAQAVRLARNSGRIRLMIVWNVDSTTTGADPQAAYAIVRGNQCLACITMGAAMAN
ncbi:MAG: LysM peptidoglycan-binding domain-containing protein [Anaerolineae bacterium]|nr:LysM peptidoglycan-binding domain-containing protein [Anaerolineae bacterium]